MQMCCIKVKKIMFDNLHIKNICKYEYINKYKWNKSGGKYVDNVLICRKCGKEKIIHVYNG